MISKMVEIAANLNLIREKILASSAKRALEYHYFEPRLVAVSKFKSRELIIEAYEAGQRHFGENYVNELVEKAQHADILEKCKDIQWHFIGHLQKNKINKILGIPNLYVIETVDSEKLATALDNVWPKFRKNEASRLKVMVQVNTSQEEANGVHGCLPSGAARVGNAASTEGNHEKNGCDVKEVPSVTRHIIENCKNLEFTGLMTIGAFGYDSSKGPNPDFISLKQCRDAICSKLNLDSKTVELSMGMSGDYEHAIELGSTSVRVGTAIFGDRPKKET